MMKIMELMRMTKHEQQKRAGHPLTKTGCWRRGSSSFGGGGDGGTGGGWGGGSSPCRKISIRSISIIRNIN